MTSLLSRLNVTYDAGYFDKDEQGWCSNHHRLSVQGDLVHVERWGDYAGREPFSVRFDARIVEVDEPNELVVLASATETMVFDLRAQRLLGSWNQGQERIALIAPPTFETVDAMGRHGLALLDGLRPGADGPLPPPDRVTLEDVEHVSIRRRTTALRRADAEVGRMDVLYAPPATVHGIDVSRSGSPDSRSRIVATWRTAEPLTLVLRGGFQASELRPIREVSRRMTPPLLCRPSLVLRALVAEAQEVGSMLSYLDHGGGADAHARIRRAAEIAAGLCRILPDALAEAGASDTARAFGENPTSGWIALEALGRCEILARPTGLRDAFADGCVVGHVLALSEADAPHAAAALAGAALRTLPADAPDDFRQALVKTRAGAEDGARALTQARETFMPFGW